MQRKQAINLLERIFCFIQEVMVTYMRKVVRAYLRESSRLKSKLKEGR